MSKTPRTDAAEVAMYDDCFAGAPQKVVPAKISRQLETELADARAEIERLKLVSQNQETVIAAQRRSAKAKNALIEQMREALEAIDAIGSEKGDASRDDALRCFSIARAALAAERGE